MRILWAASSQPGSLFPAVPIVVELLHRGHQVTAMSDDPAAEATFRKLGCEFLPELRAAAVPPPARPMTRSSKLDWWAALTQAVFADVVQVLSAEKFDVVFGDALETGVDFAAEAMGVPNCSYVHWGLDEAGPDVPFCFHLWDHAQPVDEAFTSWWNGLRALVGLLPENRPAQEHRWYRTSPLRTLLLGLPELVHPKGDLPSGVLRVGPTVWEPPSETPLPAWVAEVGASRPAVLATVSTIGGRQDVEVVVALGEAAEALDVELVATIPTGHIPPALPSHVRVTSFLPHGVLLPCVSVFVNHAGNGSVNRAACAGIPVLMLPTGRDQFQVAKGAVTAGLGLALAPEERNVEHLITAVRELIEHQNYKKAASDLAAAARNYDAPSTAADAIEALPHNQA